MKQAQAFKREVMLAPTAGTATAAGTVDLANSDYATIEVVLSKRPSTNASSVTLAIQESDDTTVTNFATFNSNLSQTVALDEDDPQVAVFHVDAAARKRYLRLLSTPGTHTTNDVVTVVGVANLDPDQRPSGTTDQGDVVAIG